MHSSFSHSVDAFPASASGSSAPERPAPHPSALSSWMSLPAAVGVLAGGLVVTGVLLPWVSTFAGLISLSGAAAVGGRLLLAAGALTVAAAVGFAARRDVRAHWAVGGLGFVTVVYGGYLLLNLLAEVHAADGMTLPALGPGLPVVLAGGALALATLFLPAPVDAADALPPADSTDTGAQAGSTAISDGRPVTTSAQLRTGTSAWLRYPAVLFAVIAAVAHVPVTPAHLREAPYIGVGFMLLTAALLLLASGLVVTHARWLWLALGGVCTAAVIAYVVSRTIGLALIGDDVGNWLEPLGVVSVVSESLAVVTAVLALRSSRQRPRVSR